MCRLHRRRRRRGHRRPGAPGSRARQRRAARARPLRRPQPGRPAPARRPLPGPAGRAGRHPRPRGRGHGRGGRRSGARRSGPATACSASSAAAGCADRVAVHERCVARVPDNLDELDAAAVPEAFITAHDAIRTRGRLTMGETLLVHGANGGVGTAALQIGLAAGARVYGVVRSEQAPRRWCASSAPSPSRDDAFADEVHADVILELVGRAALPRQPEGAQPARADRRRRHRRRVERPDRARDADGEARRAARHGAARPVARGQGPGAARVRARGGAAPGERPHARAGRPRLSGPSRRATRTTGWPGPGKSGKVLVDFGGEGWHRNSTQVELLHGSRSPAFLADRSCASGADDRPSGMALRVRVGSSVGTAIRVAVSDPGSAIRSRAARGDVGGGPRRRAPAASPLPADRSWAGVCGRPRAGRRDRRASPLPASRAAGCVMGGLFLVALARPRRRPCAPVGGARGQAWRRT